MYSKTAKKIFALLLSSFLLAALPAMAAPKDDLAAKSTATGPRKQVATIIFSGLAGAVLGLSTLSFYGRPQDKLPNIGVGFAIGIIAGATYTTYQAATQAKDLYGYEPELWRMDNRPKEFGQPTLTHFTYAWNF